MILFLPPQILVTLDLRATTLDGALPILGAKYGVPMRATPAIGEEIAILSLKAARLEEFKSRLAETFAAEWQVEPDGTLVLARSAKARNAEARASLARKREAVARGIAALAKSVREAKPFTAEAARQRREVVAGIERMDDLPRAYNGVAAPVQRLLDAVVASLDAPTVLPTGLPARVVLSTAPTPLQRSFPADVRSLLAAFRREEAIWRESDPEGGATVSAPDRLTLVAETTDVDLTLTLVAYDAAGREIDDANTTIDFEPRTTSSSPGAVEPASLKLAEDPIVTFAPAPESLRFGSVYAPDASMAGVPKNHPLAAEFLDPTARDPLSYEATDLVLSLARASGRSVVARPEDAPPYFSMFDAAEAARLVAPLSEWLGAFRFDLSHPGWLTLAAKDPYLADLRRFPRPALERALRTLHAEPRPRFETVLAVAALVPDAPVEPPLNDLLWSLAPRSGLIAPDRMKFLAALGPDGRATAEARPLRFAEMPADARARLERLFFGPDGLALQTGESRDERRSEPTFLMPRGLPADGSLRIVLQDTPMFLVRDTEGQSHEMRLSYLATYLVAKRAGRPTPRELGELDLRTIRLVPAVVRRLEFRPTPDTLAVNVFRSVAAPLPESYTLDTLPKSALAVLDAEIARLRARPIEPDDPPDAPPPS